MKQRLLIASLLLLGGVAFAAPPATKPAARPDPNATAVAFETMGFRLAVPKVWKQAQKTDRLATFQMPGGAFVVLSGKVKAGEDELKKLVDEKKKKLNDTVKGFKLVKDEATTLGAHPAWLLLYDATLSGEEITKANGKESKRTVTVVNRVMELTSVKDGTFVQLSFICAERDFPNRVKLAEKTMASFEWTARAGDGKTDADQKK